MEIAYNQLSPRQTPSGPSLHFHLIESQKKEEKGKDQLWVSMLPRCRSYRGQHAKKVASDSPGLVDLVIGLLNFVLIVTCPMGK